MLDLLYSDKIFHLVDFFFICRVRDKFHNLSSGYTIEEARAIILELKNIEESLRVGQKEKAEIIESLKQLGEDLTSIESSELPASTTSDGLLEKASIASQTDFCGDVSISF